MWYAMGEGRSVWFNVTDYSAYLKALNEPKTPVWGKPERLKAGTPAWKVVDIANGVTVLVSYNTVVSMRACGKTVELGKWSNTTTRHQQMFAKSF